jgi:hypothetical protein
VEEVKEFLNLKDDAGMGAIDYSKMKRRTDLSVVLDEFAE